jgi:threonyl-tRNA synthetase
VPDHPPAVVRATAEQAGTTAGEVLRAAGVKDSAVARIGGELRDLAHVVAEGDDVEAVPYGSDEGRAVLRHSAAHVLAQAVQDLFPGTLLGIGPPVKDGFYYDFLPERPFTPEDLAAGREADVGHRPAAPALQPPRGQRRRRAGGAGRRALQARADRVEGRSSDDDGSSVEVGSGELTIYDNLAGEELVWKDLCRGPHLPTTRDIPAFKLMRTAAAYWRGNQDNPQLQRIYGTAWESRDALKAHLTFLEEAEKRDHRRLGAELDLFSFPDEIGSGLAVFHPKGGIVRMEMEDYSRRRHAAAGYSFVNTPHASKGSLFEVSGHLQWYADGMYPPMELDEGTDYYLKPMNCPMHNLVFRSRGRSYRSCRCGCSSSARSTATRSPAWCTA